MDAARINIPDAIVLCVELPRMSGYSICAKLKKDTSLRSVPLVITSSEATQETFEHHKKLKTRAEEYLKKPFDPPVLVDVLKGYISLNGAAGGAVPAETTGQDIDIDEQPPMTLSDAEAFSEDERQTMDSGSIDEELDRLTTNPPPLPSAAKLGLADTMGLPSEGVADDEVMTMVGSAPLMSELQDAQRRESELRAALAEAERARDEAIANERKAAAQASASAVTAGASPGREVLALKKELSAKEHELLELKDTLHQKEKLLLGTRDQEVELEGKIIQAQEERDLAERQRLEFEAQAADEKERLLGEAKKLDERIEELERLLSESNAHAAELDSVLQNREEASAELAEKLREQRAENDSLSGQNRALGSEITRLTNELSAAAAESDTLREQLQSAQRQTEEAARQQANLEERLSDTRQRLTETQSTLTSTEGRLSDALAMLEAEEERKSKAKQAIDIASALLAEPFDVSDDQASSADVPEIEAIG